MVKVKENDPGTETYDFPGHSGVGLCGGVNSFAHSNYTSVQGVFSLYFANVRMP